MLILIVIRRDTEVINELFNEFKYYLRVVDFFGMSIEFANKINYTMVVMPFITAVCNKINSLNLKSLQTSSLNKLR